MEEAEALGELVRDQTAKAHVVDQHYQHDVSRGAFGAHPHRHVVGNDGDLGLEIDAPILHRHGDVLARPQHAVRAALVHQRVGPQPRRHLGAARLAHQLDVIEVGAAISPLVRAGQRGSERGRIQGEGIGAPPLVQLLGAPRQSSRGPGPVIERRLHGRRDILGRDGVFEIGGDDYQAAVAACASERAEFHRFRAAFFSRCGSLWRHEST